MNNISPKVQNQIAMMQQLQQQLQTIVQQKSQYEVAVKESKRAQEELEGVADDAEVFLNVGSVMMQQSKGQVSASLAEKTESFEIRIKSLERQESALQSKFEQLQAQIKSALEGQVPPAN